MATGVTRLTNILSGSNLINIEFMGKDGAKRDILLQFDQVLDTPAGEVRHRFSFTERQGNYDKGHYRDLLLEGMIVGDAWCVVSEIPYPEDPGLETLIGETGLPILKRDPVELPQTTVPFEASVLPTGGG